ncbi:MAG: pirin family protein [bacterium]|nr:pirin family protein [bacterium]
MITRRPANDRGHVNLGWLDSRHTFSFGEYYDPEYVNYRSLRVLNDDHIQPGRGFGTHPHKDMEIITYVLDGALAHKDSTGSASVIKPGIVQRMSAGTGIQHSEYNASQTNPAHLIQIWIVPEKTGLEPGYGEQEFDLEPGKLHLIAARDESKGVLKIHQDVALYAARLKTGDTVEHNLAGGRHAWLQVATGHLTLNGIDLEIGDGAAITEETRLEIKASADSEFLLFDLA